MTLGLSNLGSQNFQYAVQVKPVTFLVEPKSTVASQKSTITLTCQARVAPLVHSTISLPSIKWRFDKTLLVNDSRKHHITNNTNIGLSQLFINNLTVLDTGRYQCIAFDADGRYITVSKPAIVTVLSTGKMDERIDGFIRIDGQIDEWMDWCV